MIDGFYEGSEPRVFLQKIIASMYVIDAGYHESSDKIEIR